MKRTFEALKTYHNTGTPALSDDTHFFLSELLESLTYLILDFSINETTNATQLQFSYPIKKSEAKETLLFANEMVAFYLQFMDHKKSVELDTRERQIYEKLFPASCKLVTYMGGYINQDQASPEGLPEIKAGLKLLLKVFSGIVKKPAPLQL